MTGKLRLFAEINGLLIPIDVADEVAVMKALNIQSYGGNGHVQNGEQSNVGTETKVARYREIGQEDVTSYVMLNLDKNHSNLSIAEHFGIDMGKGRMENKTSDQIHAYDKVYRLAGRARDIAAERQKGKWVKVHTGIKHIATWKFKKETGA